MLQLSVAGRPCSQPHIFSHEHGISSVGQRHHPVAESALAGPTCSEKLPSRAFIHTAAGCATVAAAAARSSRRKGRDGRLVARQQEDVSFNRHRIGSTKEVTPKHVLGFLLQVPLFRTLPPSERSALANAMVMEHFEAGAPVMLQGEEGHSMYLIWSGSAAAYIRKHGEDEKEVAQYGPHDYFGEMALITDCPRVATIRCTSPTSLLRLDRRHFMNLNAAARAAVRELGMIRYADAEKRKRVLRSLTLRLVCQVVLCVAVWPLACALLLRQEFMVGTICKLLGIGRHYSHTVFMTASSAVMCLLFALLPSLRLAMDNFAQLLVLKEARPWMLSVVENLGAPLVRIMRLALTCLVIDAAANLMPPTMAVHIPAIHTPGNRHIADVTRAQLTAFSSRLFCMLGAVIASAYMLKVKRAPLDSMAVESHSKAENYQSLIDRYFIALQNPRQYEDPFFADMCSTIDRSMTVLVVVFGYIMPVCRFLGIHPQSILAIGGFSSIAVGFAAKEVLENVVSGMLLHMSKPFEQGDRIQTEDGHKFNGLVQKVGIAYSRILRDTGNTLMIPNSALLKTPLVNRSYRQCRVISATFPVVLPDFGKLGDLCEAITQAVEVFPEVLDAARVADLKARFPGLRVYVPECVFEGVGHQGASIHVCAYVSGGLGHFAYKALSSKVLLNVMSVIARFDGAIGLEAHHMMKSSTRLDAADGHDEH